MQDGILSKSLSISGAIHELPFQRFPILLNLFTALANHKIQREMRSCEKGMELRFLNEVNGTPNRGYLRIFFPSESKCVLFFHKKSVIPFSRDRFSYGGVVIDERSTSRFDSTDIEEWIEFLVNGFNPRFKPRSLKKSFPYTVPED